MTALATCLLPFLSSLGTPLSAPASDLKHSSVPDVLAKEPPYDTPDHLVHPYLAPRVLLKGSCTRTCVLHTWHACLAGRNECDPSYADAFHTHFSLLMSCVFQKPNGTKHPICPSCGYLHSQWIPQRLLFKHKPHDLLSSSGSRTICPGLH